VDEPYTVGAAHKHSMQRQHERSMPQPSPLGYGAYAAQTPVVGRRMLETPTNTNVRVAREAGEVPFLCTLGESMSSCLTTWTGGASGVFVHPMNAPSFVNRSAVAALSEMTVGGGVMAALEFNKHDFVDALGSCVVTASGRMLGGTPPPLVDHWPGESTLPMLAVQPFSRCVELATIQARLEAMGSDAYMGVERVVAAKYPLDNKWYRCVRLNRLVEERYEVRESPSLIRRVGVLYRLRQHVARVGRGRARAAGRPEDDAAVRPPDDAQGRRRVRRPARPAATLRHAREAHRRAPSPAPIR